MLPPDGKYFVTLSLLEYKNNRFRIVDYKNFNNPLYLDFKTDNNEDSEKVEEKEEKKTEQNETKKENKDNTESKKNTEVKGKKEI